MLTNLAPDRFLVQGILPAVDSWDEPRVTFPLGCRLDCSFCCSSSPKPCITSSVLPAHHYHYTIPRSKQLKHPVKHAVNLCSYHNSWLLHRRVTNEQRISSSPSLHSLEGTMASSSPQLQLKKENPQQMLESLTPL